MLITDRVNAVLNTLKLELSKKSTDFLLGLIEVDDDTYRDLMLCVSTLLLEGIAIKSKATIVSLSLVNFAIKEYQNDQFWYEYAKRLNVNEYDATKLGRASIKAFCEKNDVFFYKANMKNRYVTTILTHAILPNANMHKFLAFMHDVFVYDLYEEYIDEEVSDVLNSMYNLFKDNLDEDEIQVGEQGNKIKISAYQMPKAFRLAFVKSNKVVVPIIERILYYFDHVNYGKEVEYLGNDRFNKQFANYKQVTLEKKVL